MLTCAYKKSHFLYLPASFISPKWNLWYVPSNVLPAPPAPPPPQLSHFYQWHFNAILLILMPFCWFSYLPLFSDTFLVCPPSFSFHIPLQFWWRMGSWEIPPEAKTNYICLSIVALVEDKLQSHRKTKAKLGTNFWPEELGGCRLPCDFSLPTPFLPFRDFVLERELSLKLILAVSISIFTWRR